VASVVASTFHEAVAAGLPVDHAELLRRPAGDGRAFREMHRALMLANRATCEWAGAAIAHIRPQAPNRLESLPVLGKPEDGYFVLQPAAAQERKASREQRDHELAQLAYELGLAVAELDTEATNEGNRDAYEQVAREAAACLLLAADALTDQSTQSPADFAL
jgi:hypothetical protein